MAGASHIACPECKGAVEASEVDRVVTCGYCGARSLVERERFVPEYYIEPRVDADLARREVQSFLRTKGLPEGLLKNAKIHSSNLCFLPYHEIAARKVGVMEFGEGKARLSEVGSKKPVRSHTKVVFGDVHRIDPGLGWKDWGLVDTELMRSAAEIKGDVLPFASEAVGRLGRIYRPEIPPEKALEMLSLDNHCATVRDETAFEEVRIRRIYYPVWRIRYRYKGRIYPASIDGVTGRILFARAPQGSKARVVWLVGTMAFAGMNIGGPLAFLSEHGFFSVPAQAMSNLGALSAVFGLVWFVLLLFLVGLGWEQIRYRGEVVVRGDSRDVERIGRPSATGIDKVLASLTRVIEAWARKTEEER